jgi:hypothetical protein
MIEKVKCNYRSKMFGFREPYQKEDACSFSLEEQVDFFVKKYHEADEKARQMHEIMKEYEELLNEGDNR